MMVPCPEVVLGKGILSNKIDKLKEYNLTVITTKTPFMMVKKYFKSLKYVKLVVSSNSISKINNLLESIKQIKTDALVAVGSGTPIDVAKILAASTGLKLVAIPTILSCNAFATNKSVITNYVKKISTVNSRVPDEVIIDFDIIKCSDRRYAFSGISDVLSIYTALFDWGLAHKNHNERQDTFISGIATGLLDYAKSEYRSILSGTHKSIEKLAKMLLLSGQITNFYGSGRPESGSEHMFARAVEEGREFNRRLLHGESVLIGLLLTSEMQGQENAFLYDVARIMKIKKLIENVNLNDKKLIKYLIKASKIRRERFTIFNTIKMNYDYANRIVTKVKLKLK